MKNILLAFIIICILCCVLYYSQEPKYIEHHPYDDVISAQAVKRSDKWQTARKNYLKKHPVCEACGTNVDLNVHHIVPFHEDPSKELDPTNMITLCRTHHFEYGHRCSNGKSNWALCSNPDVRKDAQKLRRQLNK